MNPEKNFGSSTETEIAAEKPPKPSYGGLFRFCTRRDLGVLIPAIIVAMISGLLIPAFTILLGKIFTSFGSFSSGRISGRELQDQITPFVIQLCIVGAAAWVLGWLHMAFWLAFGENMARRAREQIMKGLLEKNMTWFDSKVVDSGVSGSMNKAIKYIPTCALVT